VSSGRKQAIINTQERAISVDINRLQSFAAADSAELFRYLLDCDANDDTFAGGSAVDHTTLDTPLRAEIINGYQATPQSGGLGVSVSAGVLLAIAPDSDPDASNYKYLRSGGLAFGTLSFAVGATATRIDILEVSFGSATIESASRDVFNDLTGLFTATSLPKAVQGQATFRIRQGTPGGSFASVGLASGWLPLMVASIPSTATTCDAMDFWDVRPLIGDREIGIMPLVRSFPKYERCFARIDNVTAPGTALVQGYFEGTYAGRRLGGNILKGTPAADPGYVDLNDTTQFDPALSGTIGSGIYYVYLLTPFGLPRWARYTRLDDVVVYNPRVPRSPRGMLVISGVVPNLYGAPTAAVGLPTSTGLGGSAIAGLCAFAAPAYSGSFLSGVIDGRVHHLSSPLGNVSGTNTGSALLFTLTDGTTHPANARAIYVRVSITATLIANAFSTNYANFYLGYPGNADPSLGYPLVAIPTETSLLVNPSGSVSASIPIETGLVRIPLVNGYPSATIGSRVLAMEFSDAVVSAVSDFHLNVYGWDLGP
jgi:hypothetical protein